MIRISYLEATARQRLHGLLDPGSIHELIPPTQREVSPFLSMFDAPVAFDDGAIVGEATLGGKPVLFFAQEGKFRGGALGEVHASKIVGILKRALKIKPAAVLGLFDSGGVRLEEANAGEIGATEIIRSILAARSAGIPILGLIGGSTGCFGGAGIISCCCDTLIASEEGRVSVSGPEVIETVMGVEAFDSRDRSLVWRTTGGKNRFLFGTVTRLVKDHVPDFRQNAMDVLDQHRNIDLASLEARKARLAARIERFGDAKDALDVWKIMGLDAAALTGMSVEKLATLSEGVTL